MTTVLTTFSRVSAILILFSLLLIASYPVWAKESTTGGTTRVATREAALKAKLERFKDKRKAETAERVNSNLAAINQKHTERMLKFLDRATTILNKLERRVNEGSSDVADARTAIASAKASVNSQAEKDYTIAVSSENTVRKDAQKIREQLHNDLKAVRIQVIDAKQAVANAIRVAKSGKLERPKKEGTPSGRE